jgi:hypothetical protein
LNAETLELAEDASEFAQLSCEPPAIMAASGVMVISR